MYLLKYKIETVKQNTYLLVNSFTPLAIGRTEKFCLSALSLSLSLKCVIIEIFVYIALKPA